jgi:hypothetical protein
MRVDLARIDDLLDRHILTRAMGSVSQVTRPEDDRRLPFTGHDVGVTRTGETSQFRLPTKRGAVRALKRSHGLVIQRQIDRVQHTVDDRVVDDRVTPSITARI